MRVLIIYASKNGVTERCAQLLKQSLPNCEVTLHNLKTGQPDLGASYDWVVVGGPIRFEKLYRPVRVFLSAQNDWLKQQSLALFLCCGLVDRFDDYLRLIPSSLRESARDIACFGGEIKPDKVRGWDRLFLRFLRESIISEEEGNRGEYERVLPEIVTENITRLAEIIRGIRPV